MVAVVLVMPVEVTAVISGGGLKVDVVNVKLAEVASNDDALVESTA